MAIAPDPKNPSAADPQAYQQPEDDATPVAFLDSHDRQSEYDSLESATAHECWPEGGAQSDWGC